MKTKLKFFCVGFGVGLLVAFLLIGLAPDRPSEQWVGTAWVPENSTNLNMRLRWKAMSASYPALQKNDFRFVGEGSEPGVPGNKQVQ